MGQNPSENRSWQGDFFQCTLVDCRLGLLLLDWRNFEPTPEFVASFVSPFFDGEHSDRPSSILISQGFSQESE